MDNLEPISRTDFYLDFLNNGGELVNLPEPVSRSDFYLYQLCVKSTENSGGGSSSVNVVDNLNSLSTIDALSANQGRILNEKKLIQELSVDKWNNGLGIRFTDGDYMRLQIENIPTIANTLWKVQMTEKNELDVTLTNRDRYQISMPFIVGIDKDIDGNLVFTRGNGNIITVTFADGKVNTVVETQPILNIAEHTYFKLTEEGGYVEVPELEE